MNMQVRFYHRCHNKSAGRARLAFAAAAFLAISCGDRAATYLDEGRRAAAAYDYEKAAVKFELAATAFKHSRHAAAAREELNRCRAEIYFNRAEELIYRGAAYSALADVVAGRRLDAANARGLFLAGLAHLSIGLRDIAFQEFNAAIIRAPASPYGYLGRAEYFRFALRRDDALADYMRAMRVARGDVRGRGAAYRGVRDMAHKLNKPEPEIAALLREGTSHVPPEAIYYRVGYYYLRKPPVGIADAKFYFTKSREAAETPLYAARACAGLAECHLFYKEYDAAKAYIDQALAADAENDAYYKIAAKIYGPLKLPAPEKGPK